MKTDDKESTVDRVESSDTASYTTENTVDGTSITLVIDHCSFSYVINA